METCGGLLIFRPCSYDSAIAVLVHDCQYQVAGSSPQPNASEVVHLISSSDEEIASLQAQIRVDHFADDDFAPGIPSSSSDWRAAKKPKTLTTPREHISTESNFEKQDLDANSGNSDGHLVSQK